MQQLFIKTSGKVVEHRLIKDNLTNVMHYVRFLAQGECSSTCSGHDRSDVSKGVPWALESLSLSKGGASSSICCC